jgi:hypothetical protein
VVHPPHQLDVAEVARAAVVLAAISRTISCFTSAHEPPRNGSC